MKMVERMRIDSSIDAVVFAQHFESNFEKQLLTSRAKREQRVKAFLESADIEARRVFLKTLAHLDGMLCRYATVSERLLLFFDNNVIQDISKQNSEGKPVHKQRVHALLAFLALAEDYYCLDVFACITPVVLYEASGRGVRPISEVEAEVRSLMASVGLATYSVGYSSFQDAGSLFKRIRRDEKALGNALREINDKSWARSFVGDGLEGIRIPLSLAEEECPVVQLTYFHPWYVKFVLMHAIEKLLFAANSNKSVRSMMMNPQEMEFSILKLKGDRVKGLGDLELLSLCELATQTLTHPPNIKMGVTFDDGLRHALLKRANVRGSLSVDSSVDDVHDSSLRFAYWMRESEKRTRKANRRLAEYASGLQLFMKSLKDYFVDIAP
jgi:hypothetical protein